MHSWRHDDKDILIRTESDVNQTTKPAAFSTTGLMAAKEITKTVNISRAHLHNLVARGMFPKPALVCGTRYTRWKAQDVMAWLNDPQGWRAANAPSTSAEA